MAQILVRKLTEEAHRSLKARARAENRSAEALAREILECALTPEAEKGFGDALASVWHGADLTGVEIDSPRVGYEPLDLS